MVISILLYQLYFPSYKVQSLLVRTKFERTSNFSIHYNLGNNPGTLLRFTMCSFHLKEKEITNSKYRVTKSNS